MRWLNPQDPRGTTVWGTLAMSALIAVLFTTHGAPSEVWPNRCALLRAQLIERPIYSVQAGLPALTEGELIPASIRAAHVHAPDSSSGGPSLRIELSDLQGIQLSVALYPLSLERLDPLAEQLSVRPDLLTSHAQLTRQALKMSPEALTCAPQFSSTEQNLTLGLLLKGGLLREAPAGVEGFGYQGEEAWFARWGAGAPVMWRLWAPIAGGPEQPRWLAVWTRHSPSTEPSTTGAWSGESALKEALTARSIEELSRSLLSLSDELAQGRPDPHNLTGLAWLKGVSSPGASL